MNSLSGRKGPRHEAEENLMAFGVFFSSLRRARSLSCLAVVALSQRVLSYKAVLTKMNQIMRRFIAYGLSMAQKCLEFISDPFMAN